MLRSGLNRFDLRTRIQAEEVNGPCTSLSEIGCSRKRLSIHAGRFQFETAFPSKRGSDRCSRGSLGFARWLLAFVLLAAFCLPPDSLLGSDEDPFDIPVIEQFDSERVELEKGFDSGELAGIITRSVTLHCLGEIGQILEGSHGFCFRQLLCLGSRGPPSGWLNRA